jgi:hypothetical protein
MAADPSKAHDAAALLRGRGNVFVHRDWVYTRDLGGLEQMRFRADHTGRNRVHRRLGQALRHALFPGRWSRLGDLAFLRPRSVGGRLHWLAGFARKPSNLPDGALDGGRILVSYEETGQYLQLLQPSVGTLLADWLDDRPTDPHAVRLAAEILRVSMLHDHGQGPRAPAEPEL